MEGIKKRAVSKDTKVLSSLHHFTFYHRRLSSEPMFRLWEVRTRIVRSMCQGESATTPEKTDCDQQTVDVEADYPIVESGISIQVQELPLLVYHKQMISFDDWLDNEMKNSYNYIQLHFYVKSHIQFSSVAQSCPTLCDPTDCSTPGLPVHQLSEFTQTHAHRVSDAIQPSHLLSSPSPTFNLSHHQGLFQ